MPIGRNGVFRLPVGNDINFLSLDDAEILVLSILGEEGPLSAYTICGKSKYVYEQIRKTLNRLQKKGLVHEIAYIIGHPSKKLLGLTFYGFLWYAKDNETRGRLRHFLNTYNDLDKTKHKSERIRTLLIAYQELMPFCPIWDKMIHVLTEEKCLSRLAKTMTNFFIGKKSPVQIDSLGLECEVYLDFQRIIHDQEPEVEVELTRDEAVAKFLLSEEGFLLRQSYIAYLVNEDVKLLSKLGSNEIEYYLPKMKSNVELLHFEKDGLKDSIFKGGRLKEFLPKYGTPEYYFTGMFVKNLLWN